MRLLDLAIMHYLDHAEHFDDDDDSYRLCMRNSQFFGRGNFDIGAMPFVLSPLATGRPATRRN